MPSYDSRVITIELEFQTECCLRLLKWEVAIAGYKYFVLPGINCMLVQLKVFFNQEKRVEASWIFWHPDTLSVL